MKAKKRLALVILGICIVLVGWYIAVAGESLSSDDIRSLAIQQDRDVLKGLAGVYVLVENMRPEVEKFGLTKQAIQTDVELELRKFGVRVLSQKESLAILGSPYLYVNVNAMNLEGTDRFYGNIGVAMRENVILLRKPIMSNAATWGSSHVFKGASDRDVRDNVKECVDEFINDYLAANPKEQVSAKDVNDSGNP